MKHVFLTTVLAAGTLAGGCDGTSETKTIQKNDVFTLTGLLRNDSNSPEGMITGWVVNDESNNGQPVPVDITAVVATAQSMAGNRVAVKGRMMDHLDAGGKQNPVFVAESIALAK